MPTLAQAPMSWEQQREFLDTHGGADWFPDKVDMTTPLGDHLIIRLNGEIVGFVCKALRGENGYVEQHRLVDGGGIERVRTDGVVTFELSGSH